MFRLETDIILNFVTGDFSFSLTTCTSVTTAAAQCQTTSPSSRVRAKEKGRKAPKASLSAMRPGNPRGTGHSKCRILLTRKTSRLLEESGTPKPAVPMGSKAPLHGEPGVVSEHPLGGQERA